MLEPARETVADGVLEALVVQHRRVDEAAERGLSRADLLGLAPYLAPDRIVALDLALCGSEGLLHRILTDFPAHGELSASLALP